ncbi:MAG TPA: N-acetylmuramoyl-L-alanine amidase [Longimicrobium sp.]|jgi:N-acetylmuramoyl-L-alanine amidase
MREMRAVPALLFFAALSLTVPTLSAQSRGAAWRLEAGLEPVRVAETATRGYAALPASALVSLGAELAYEGEEVVARLAATEVRFRPGSAEVRIGAAPHTLSNPVYAEDGVVYVPADFFRRFLADASGGALEVEPADRVVRRVGNVAPPPALASREGTGDRGQGTAGITAPAGPSPSDAAPPAAAPARPVAVPASARPARRLVVVDAGHGGRDPGARGPNGAREKDVTLRVARRVAALLRDDPGFDVRMTRDRDTLIALHDRARLANRWKGEGQPAVFISIHCNANESRSEKGFETYFLSEARTADARRVEQFENSAVQYEEAPPQGALGFILADLRQNHYLRESSDWAQIIQDRLREIHPGPDRGVKQAGFAVLRGTFMPSVLVEMAFISNRGEEALLTDDEAQERFARQLARAVRDYFDRPAVRPASDH